MSENFKLRHVGWAVNSIEDAAKALETLGFKKNSQIIDDAERSVRILLMENQGGESVELVSPLGCKTPVSNFLSKNGPSPYHCCFATNKNRIAETMRSLKEAGFRELKKSSPAPALGNNEVIFLYSKEIGIVELELRDSQDGEC